MAEESNSPQIEDQTSSTDVAEHSKENIPSKLNEKQQQFIDDCEKEFADRYTEADPDYKKLLENDIGDPPIVDPWYCKPRRNFNWSRGRNDNFRRNDGHDGRRRNYGNDGRDRYRNFGDGGRDRNREYGDDRRYRDRNQYYGHRRNPY